MRKRPNLKSLSSAIVGASLNVVVVCDTTGQYLNLVEPDSLLSLSFWIYDTVDSKLTQTTFSKHV